MSKKSVIFFTLFILVMTAFPVFASDNDKILVYCAAVARKPIAEAAKQFEAKTGIRVEVQYGGSGMLLSGIRLTHKGDIYIPIDEDYITMAKKDHLTGETFPLAITYPVIVVRKGNPKNISGIDDLLRKDVRLSLANPKTASIGRATKTILGAKYDQMEKKATVTKTIVSDVANDVKMGLVDAGIIWNALLPQYPDLDRVDVPVFKKNHRKITAVFLTTSKNRNAAMKFAKYLVSKDGGIRIFKEMGYEVPGR